MSDETTTTPPSDATAAATAGNNAGSGQQAAQTRTFTQAEMDEHAKERARRAEESTAKKLRAALDLDKHGLSDEEAKELLANAIAKREADKTETDREKQAREKAEKDRDDFKTKYETEVAARRADRRDARVKDALTAANAKADKVLKLLKVDHAAALDALLTDEGEVDQKKLDALIATAKADYAEDFGRQGLGSPSVGGGRVPEAGRADKDRAREQVRQRNQGW